MTNFSNPASFVASATATLTAPSSGGVVAMPAVDSGNTSLTVANNAGSAVFLLFGTSASLPVALAQNASAIVIQPGQTILLTGAQAAVSAVATFVSICPQNATTASIVVQRGTVSTPSLFQ